MTAPIATIRAGDADRDTTARLLGLALAQGYLEMPEYESRLQTAFTAGTRPELHALTADLPVAHLRRNDPARRAALRRAARRSVQFHVAGYLAGSLLMLDIWLTVGLTAGSWYFWPVWPIMGWGIGVICHAVPAMAHGSIRPTRIA
ncbi:DUF1707 domain-containing protein [Mycolicibacterium flavescens]|uniref:Uncharacterized protein n=1 Tax=Mycolicibacterium flavescens TaxID=1776 RepID=A0A1E3RFT3_MYCFV|nr:DUF1707 domain-containing protein [Mycolicibacterium flavescens]MCV7282801.1 DUF1707 domain-containing protein [Mycolicibacterium flavescens]ODQ88713.1 hypothetical protein BHQ18_17780 [Mycolicibacterium flavescens]